MIVEAPKAVLRQRQVSNEYRQPVEGAHVELSDRSWTAWLVYSTRNGLYSLPVRYSGIGRPVPGRTYTLTVSAPGYPDVTAQCTVPVAVVPSEIRLDSTSQTNFGQGRVVYVSRLVWKDPVGQINFYKVSGRVSKTQQRPLFTKPVRDTIVTDSETIYFENSSLTVDKDRDGEQFISPKANYTNYDYNPANRIRDLRFVMTLNTVDENYYRYHDAINW